MRPGGERLGHLGIKRDLFLYSPWPASSRPSNFLFHGTKLDGRVKPAHGEYGVVLCVETLRRTHAQGFQFAMQSRALHADERGSAGDVAAEAVDLRHQIIAFENLPRFP